MPIRPNNDKKVCTLCKRHKNQAISEQLEEGKTCGHPGCEFKKEIKAAIDNKTKIKIRKMPLRRIKIRKLTGIILLIFLVPF